MIPSWTVSSQAVVSTQPEVAIMVLKEGLSHSTATTTPFTHYVITYRIEANRQLWNHYHTERPRTTHHLKGWHSGLKKMIQVPHLNIYTLLNYPQEEQAF